MQTTRLISALASAAVLFATAHASAGAQTSPPVQTAAPITTPTKVPTDTMTPVAGPTKAPVDVTTPAPGGATPGVPGVLALDARSLRARRTPTGYTLTGEALVNDPCYAARFDPSLLTIYPPQLNLDQFRRPDRRGMFCIQRLIWVTAQPRTVTSAKPPAYVTVRTKSGVTRIPIR